MEAVIAHEIEPELAGPPPRKARLPWRTQALLVVAGALALLLFLGGARALLESAKLGWVAAFGRAAVARVTAVQTQATPGQPAVPVRLRYEYADPFAPAAPPVRGSVHLVAEVGDASAPPNKAVAPPVVHVGDPLPLRVARWRGRPVAYFWAPAPGSKGIFLGLCGLVVMGVSVGLVRALALWRRARVRLLREGWAVVGTVTHKRTEAHDAPRYFLRYGYATGPDGAAREGEEQVSVDQWKRFEVGQPVTVLFDPSRPAHAGLYALMKNA